MKILFVMPKVGAWATHGKHFAPNQMYAHWAAFVREKGYRDVDVLDCTVLDISIDGIGEKVSEKAPDAVVLGDMIHCSVGFGEIWHFNEAAAKIKQALPKIKIVVGGLWYSSMPVDTLEENPAIDYVVMGEEEAFYDLIMAIDTGTFVKDISGIASRVEGKPVLGPHRPLLMNLDSLPLPAYDLFPMEKYVGHTYWKPFVEMVTSRGCPSACTLDRKSVV